MLSELLFTPVTFKSAILCVRPTPGSDLNLSHTLGEVITLLADSMTVDDWNSEVLLVTPYPTMVHVVGVTCVEYATSILPGPARPIDFERKVII